MTASPPPLTWQRGTATLQPSAAVGSGPKGVSPSTSQALRKLSARSMQRTRTIATRAIVSPRRSRRISDYGACKLASALPIIVPPRPQLRRGWTTPLGGLASSTAGTSSRRSRNRHLNTVAQTRPSGTCTVVMTTLSGVATLMQARRTFQGLARAVPVASTISDTEGVIGFGHSAVIEGVIGMLGHSGSGGNRAGGLATTVGMISHIGVADPMQPPRSSVVAPSLGGLARVSPTVG